ncbi:putative membrane protein [Aequorivita sublithincola DSM 14238]|uniref:Putative membrane protein n=1 Tax=Aequorivita sublithincola (strain DSM 14238 / LMG 21431 / ACAM 643 / 9-3) TaxID=746697 RepID=I3Z001_AEQSU|nr:YetF domain-containing protein [Aequorivita sublithincola]AFL82569.1 putative membrane protein [Aequorivita sublithincola DSM 14238]
MENWLYASLPIIAKVFITVLAIFALVILITRISGLRTFAKISSFDFASTIAIGSIIASIILNPSNSILKGGFALASIVLFQSLFTYLIRKVPAFEELVTNKPMLIMKDGVILTENLHKTNLSEENLIAKLREANVIDFDEVRAVVLESTGDVSVLHTNSDKKLMDKMLKGVRLR